MAKTSSGFLRTPRQIAFFLGFFALLGAAFSLAYPYVKKAGVIRDTGQATISALAPLSIAIAHYSVADISTMMANPGITQEYKSLSALLTEVCDAGGYSEVSIIFRGVGGKSYYLASSNYRDNATVDVDFPTPGSEYPAKSYRGITQAVDSVFTSLTKGSYANEITIIGNGVRVLPVYIPVNRGNISLISLAVNCPVPTAGFNMIGSVDLNHVSIICMAALILMGMCVFFIDKMIVMREARIAKKQAAEEEKRRQEMQKAREDEIRREAIMEERRRIEATRKDSSTLDEEAATEPQSQTTGSPDREKDDLPQQNF